MLRFIAGLLIGLIGLNIALLPKGMEIMVYRNMDMKERNEKHTKLLAHCEKYRILYMVSGLVLMLFSLWLVSG